VDAVSVIQAYVDAIRATEPVLFQFARQILINDYNQSLSQPTNNNNNNNNNNNKDNNEAASSSSSSSSASGKQEASDEENSTNPSGERRVGLMEGLLNWILNILEMSRKDKDPNSPLVFSLDMNRLVQDIFANPQEFAHLREELDAIVDYRKWQLQKRKERLESLLSSSSSSSSSSGSSGSRPASSMSLAGSSSSSISLAASAGPQLIDGYISDEDVQDLSGILTLLPSQTNKQSTATKRSQPSLEGSSSEDGEDGKEDEERKMPPLEVIPTLVPAFSA
jgi:hypothetical protein